MVKSTLIFRVLHSLNTTGMYVMEHIILQAQKLGLWRPLDIHFAHFIASLSSSPNAIFLASACLSADISIGHICLPLSLLTPDTLFDGRYPQLAQQAWQQAGSLKLEAWHNVLLTSQSVSDGSKSTPLVLDNQQLYLHRLWQDECTVANFFQRQLLISYDEKIVHNILNRLFPANDNTINWQKIAIAIALTCQVSIISYTVSTDKTTLLTKLLTALLQVNHSDYFHIIIAAPTSKIAARLTKYIDISMMRLTNYGLKYKINCQVMTIYQLLDIQPNSRYIRYCSDNPLYLDVLILDESSMVDLPLMSNLIKALPTQARVIFIGDHYQFASVEMGTIFSDLCQLMNYGYSIQRCKELSRLTGYQLSTDIIKNNRFKYQVIDSLCLLRHHHSLPDSSGISILANMINSGNGDNVLTLLNSRQYSDLYYIELNSEQDYQRMVNNCVTSYSCYLQLLHTGKSPNTIIEEFNRYRLLSMLIEGKFGVIHLNRCIEQALIDYGLLKKKDSIYYIGRPIILLHNIQPLGLYNGDIGIILSDGEHHIPRAYFMLPNNSIKIVNISNLPKHKTAFVITIYQSQGLKFTHTTLVIPDNVWSPTFTRELLYTGVTRARKLLSIYAPNNGIVSDIITQSTQRRSGLKERLLELME